MQGDETPRRVALVTGGNRCIGFETCRQLADRGFEIALGARDPARARRAVRALERDGHAARVVTLDVIDPESVCAAAAEVEQI